MNIFVLLMIAAASDIIISCTLLWLLCNWKLGENKSRREETTQEISNMKRPKNLLNQAKHELTNKYFIGASLSFLIMVLICWLGNPSIGRFYFHFIPEMTAFYLVGFWLCSRHYSLKYPLVIYLLSTVLTPITLGGGHNPFRYIIPALLASPLVLGYVTAKKLWQI